MSLVKQWEKGPTMLSSHLMSYHCSINGFGPKTWSKVSEFKEIVLLLRKFIEVRNAPDYI